jgi:hypothetical protein
MFSSNTEHDDEYYTIGYPCHRFVSKLNHDKSDNFCFFEMILQMDDFVSTERDLRYQRRFKSRRA